MDGIPQGPLPIVRSTEEVEDDELEDNVAEEKVGKGTFGTDSKLALLLLLRREVLSVALKPQTDCSKGGRAML